MVRCMHCLVVLGLLPLLGTAQGQQAKNEVKLTKDEQLVLDLVNKARAQEKLPPLKPHPLLIQAARGHSANMAKHKKQDHVLDGKTPDDRLDAVKYDFMDSNENIGFMETRGKWAVLFDLWMKSPTHRPNILGKFAETGIGIAPGKQKLASGKEVEGFWITQVFTNPQ